MTLIFTRVNCLKTAKYLGFYSTKVVQNEGINVTKVVNVAIIGAPNSGKSTLINNIVKRKICAASNKVHTTTKLARAMSFDNDTQIVFLDTPGVVTVYEKKKYNLPESLTSSCEKSLNCANVIGVVHDVSNRYTKSSIHPYVLSMLNMVDSIPKFLILNKVDKIKEKKHLLSIISSLTNGLIAGNPIPRPEKSRQKLNSGYSNFSDVFLVSALNGDGVDDVKNYLLNNAKEARLQYPAHKWTDQDPETILIEAVRAKFLDFLHNEIPYKLKVNLEYYEDDIENNKIVCHVAVECPSERLARLISGAGGGRLNQIKSFLTRDLIETFKKPVLIDLRLTVKNVDVCMPVSLPSQDLVGS